MADAEDAIFMHRAMREARKGIGLTSPNPPVGAILVRKGGIVGHGWHRKAGGPHAEIEALNSARQSPKGATLYVTLEPCSTHGRTPPCTDAIVAAGIRRVVYACTDPHGVHDGRARSILEKAGIEVTVGVGETEGCELLRPWTKFITRRLPWVIAKAGMSLDGKITRPPGEGQWLTDETARADAMKLRRRCDAILVGAETVRRDNPSLTLRPPVPAKTQPWRVVLTKSGRLPPDARLFTDDHRERTLVFKSQPLERVLSSLATEHGVVTVLIEGGGTIFAQAFAHRLVDEVCFYTAPMLCGTGRPVIDAGHFVGGSVTFENVRWKPVGNAIRCSGLVRYR